MKNNRWSFLALPRRELKDLPPAIDWKASDSLGIIMIIIMIIIIIIIILIKQLLKSTNCTSTEHENLVVNNSGNPRYTGLFELFSILSRTSRQFS